MTQVAMLRYKFGNKQFPILYEGNGLRVYTNHCGELFVESTVSNAEMRINACRDGIEFTTDSDIVPTVINNTIGWCVRSR